MTIYKYINTLISDEIKQEILNSEIIGLDIETNNQLNPHEGHIRLIQINTGTNLYIFDCYKSNTIELFKHKELWKNKIVIGHNLKFECKWLWKNGIDLSDTKFLFDTEIASRLVSNGLDFKHSLKAVCERYLNVDLSKVNQMSDWTLEELSEDQLEYAALDVYYLFELRKLLIQELKEKELIKIAALEFKALFVIASLEYNGIYLDAEYWESLIPKYKQIAKDGEHELLKALPNVFYQESFYGDGIISLNINSNTQLLAKFQELGIPCKSTSAGELVWISDDEYPALKPIKKLRNALKMLATFLAPYKDFICPNTGRIHYNAFQLGAETGRLAVKEPSILTIPTKEDFRKGFKPQKEGFLYLDTDYGQIESRIIAVMTQEPTMLEIFNTGVVDIYSATAALENNYSFEEFLGLEEKVRKELRQGAKAEVLGLCYGMGIARYQGHCKQKFDLTKTEQQAREERNRFFNTYKGLPKWHKLETKGYETKPYLVNKTGRKYFGEIGYNAAINFPVQSLQADLMKDALTQIFFTFKDKYGVLPLFDISPVFFVAYVHDEILLEVREDIALEVKGIVETTLITVAESYLNHEVKITADGKLGSNWAECH